MEPKATQKKGVQSRLRDESPKWRESIEEYSVSIKSTPLVPHQTRAKYRGRL